MEGRRRVLILILVAVLALGCGFAGGLLASHIDMQQLQTSLFGPRVGNETTTPVEQAPEDTGTTAAAQQQTTVVHTQDPNIGEAIADKVLPSVVGIETSYEVSIGGGYSYFFGGGGGKTLTTAQGTGFVVDEAGYILTNSHVVNDGNYRTVTVLLYDGREFSGTVLWNDPTLDMAIVKIEAAGLVAAELGDSDTVKVGSYAAAIGNPLGLQFKFSMSQGIISGLERTIEVSSGTGYNTTTMEGLLQTDATINSGNSGGPLVNSSGQVIAINSAKATSGEGMGFAIPINSAKPIVDQIKQTGQFKRAYLGITGIGLEESNNYDANEYKTRYGTARGIYVYSVAENGGAAAAGLQKGDIVINVAGTEVGTMNKINTVLVAYKEGDAVNVVYVRAGVEYSTQVVLTGALE
ncbi:MAG: trypsin-like peptidase domain-containing protein [Clostridia bacterium]|nr:trypsin-like peptidase domain-containing protein [Clostridia bacterium]